MIRLSMVAVPPTDDRLAAIRQLGVEALVHYDMANAPDKFDTFPEMVARARRFGLSVPVVEAGPAIDRIVLGKDGAAEQTRGWLRDLDRLGRAGVKVVAYNFMPQLSSDAMVVRTDFDARTRGGARTTAFRRADLRPDTVPHAETPIGRERMWDNLERFLRAVIPAAEAAGVTLAMHPDDPPLSPIAGLERIISSIEDFDRLLALNSSPANAMTLCAGCFGELGADVPALVRRYAGRIGFVHLRNLEGTLDDFTETFPDEGNLDLAAILRALAETGFDGYVRPDHAPQLATEPAGVDGYGFEGHVFTLGYVRGILDGLRAGGELTERADDL
jgi:mannonate dehydratase